MKKVLVTGVAGFIGRAVAAALLQRGDFVVGIDNLNPYYDVNLKKARIKTLEQQQNFQFYQLDIADNLAVQELFASGQFTDVINLAAQAGVRYSLENPHVYIDSNIVGFTNILEACRHFPLRHLVFASSSSVYGANTKQPFAESMAVDHPLSIYAATKKANELMAHSYSHLYKVAATGLRFFTVYGPWGRPDMALFKFTKAMLAGDAIDVYNNGDMIRDFTYIDDIVAGVLAVLDKPATACAAFDSNNPNPAISRAPYRLFNIGNNTPVKLMDFIEALQQELGIKAKMNLMPMQPGDVPATHADVSSLEQEVNFSPNTTIASGIKNFVDWYRGYYKN